jgi:hypothetical protein
VGLSPTGVARIREKRPADNRALLRGEKGRGRGGADGARPLLVVKRSGLVGAPCFASGRSGRPARVRGRLCHATAGRSPAR